MYVSNWTFRPAAGKFAEVIENCKKGVEIWQKHGANECRLLTCLLYTSPSPRD